MPLPRFQLRTLLVVVPLVGVVLALETAAWNQSVSEGLAWIQILAIAWVPVLFLLLDTNAAGWLFVLAILSSAMLLVAVLSGSDCGPNFGVTLWLTFAFGLGFVASKGLHQPGPSTHQGQDGL
jgi:hypothetical protein